MLFFRSEERAREWCEERGHPLRPLVSMAQLWALATTWYSSRLDPESRRPAPGEMIKIFSGLGLADEFWDPTADSFGGVAS